MTEYGFILLFAFFGIPVSIHDIRTLRIPLACMYAGLASGILYDVFLRRQNLLPDLIAMILIAVIFMAVRLISKKGLGLGDIQYSLMCGFFSGLPYVIAASLFSSLLGILYFIFLALLKKTAAGKKVPFGPFMTLGTIIAMLLKPFMDKFLQY